MTTTQPVYTWHDDVTINGRPYPTRHPVPDHGPHSDAYLGDLDDSTRQYLHAIHEAAHAVAALTAQAHVHYARITPTGEMRAAAQVSNATSGGDTYVCNFTTGRDQAIYFGVGERAGDLWLRQNNLWTPTRSVGIELSAYGDRHTFLTANPHFGFGVDHNDYRVVHDLADELVTRHWTAITAVADRLTVRLHLAGDEIAALAQMPNGTHSSTCTYSA